MKSFLNYEYENLLNEEAIDQDLYDKYDVKRGLRNNNGTGVLVGLTRVAEVSGYYVEDGVKKSKIGNLYYRGIDIPILGIMCGMDATKNITKNIYNNNVSLVKSNVKYHVEKNVEFYEINVNPIYEGKCISYLRDGDLFYIVA